MVQFWQVRPALMHRGDAWHAVGLASCQDASDRTDTPDSAIFQSNAAAAADAHSLGSMLR
jgi:hypothetical protein